MSAGLGADKAAEEYRVYVGTYTDGASEGIYRLAMNRNTGKLTRRGVVRGVTNPSFLAIHPNRRFLYAVNEVGQFRGAASGAVSAFAIDAKTGDLRFLNQQPSGGAAPCHLVVNRKGRNVLVANYTGGSVASLPISEDGRLAPAVTFLQHTGSSVLARQKGPHAHSINLDDQNRFAVVADLGLDQVLVYKFDAATGKLVANTPPGIRMTAGAGPRHFDFHPNHRFAYVINEIDLTITAFAYDARRGVLKPLQTVRTLPVGTDNTGSTADVQVHRSGRFLYGSNRGHDSIVVFAIDQKTGRLTYVEHESTGGRTPRNFGLDPSGRFLLAANQSTDSIVVFRIDPATGALSATGHQVDVPSPVCIQMISATPSSP
ncbi:MAG: lactonase family protein [Planctomycetaceae bacterium]